MKNFRFVAAAVLLSGVTISACAKSSNSSSNKDAEYPTCDQIQSIPTPPVGKRWVVNEQFSDEFNGKELDQTKWFDHHPTWRGRYPALFMPENVSVKGGYLRLKSSMLDEEVPAKPGGVSNSETNFYAGGAAVVSRTQEAHYGYYECRFKANKLTLSSTFWFSSRRNFETDGRQPEGTIAGKFDQELDVCECIGRSGDFDGSFFSEGMNSNVHYWLNPSTGGRLDIRAKESRLKREDGVTPSESFNTYGVWWKDEESAAFYLNNGEPNETKFVGRLPDGAWGEFNHEFKFTEPMGLNMVVETYPTPWITLPTREELADDSRNTTLYDWVRAYKLIDADGENPNAAPMLMFEDKINVSVSSGNVVAIEYTAPEDREIEVVAYDAQNNKMWTKSVAAPAGYSNFELKIDANNFAAVVASMGKPGKKAVVADSCKR